MSRFAALVLLLKVSTSEALISPRALGQSTPKKQLEIDIFYESQCPFSLEFLNTSLREAYNDKDFWNSMSLRLHPAGNALAYKSSDLSPGYHFWHPDAEYPKIMCQHGSMECLGNRIQACVIALHPEAKDHVPFIMCMASYGLHAGVEMTSYACGQKLGIDMDAVKMCTDSPQAHAMMVAIGKTTRSANVTHVPWVTLDDEHTKDDAFFTPVCDAIGEDAPTVCKKLTKASTDDDSVHEKNEHCGGSGGSFLAKGSKVTPCRKGKARKTEVTHVTYFGVPAAGTPKSIL
jgi:interferon gamma-inducible protein 30